LCALCLFGGKSGASALERRDPPRTNGAIRRGRRAPRFHPSQPLVQTMIPHAKHLFPRVAIAAKSGNAIADGRATRVRHGMSLCLAFRSAGSRRLASEMSSIPRSSSHHLRRSASKASSVTPVNSLRMSSIASMMSVRRAVDERSVIQNTCNADASIRSLRTRCRLRLVTMSALHPRMRDAVSFTSINS
jgi:hypothetical protein